MTDLAKPQPQETRRARKTDGVASGNGQIVLVLQGGGALGAFQAGVYHALHDAGVEPDWVSAPPSAPSTPRSSSATSRTTG